MFHEFREIIWHIGEASQNYFHRMSVSDIEWLVLGLLGQLLFMTRFIIQWIHSERHQKSLVPVSFWYLSLFGSIIVLGYGIHKVEPVIIFGQLPGSFIYLRNLMLIKKVGLIKSKK
jgi:lipid-A-disaccharide synthase-like uncharacterized protein